MTHEFILFFGDEDCETFDRELADIVPVINKLVAKKQIRVGPDKKNKRTIKVQPLLCCDMKALVRLLGLYDVFKPNTCYKCAWCEVSSDSE